MIKVPSARVLVGVPSGDRLCAETAMDIAMLVSFSRPVIAGLLNAQHSCIDHNHNDLVEQSHKINATHIMFIDSDQRFPEDALAVLLNHRKDIVGATYRIRNPPHSLITAPVDPTQPRKGLREEKWITSGCMLVNSRVFDAIEYPWFRHTYGKSTAEFQGGDKNFCLKAVGMGGFKCWVDHDLSRRVEHICGNFPLPYPDDDEIILPHPLNDQNVIPT